MNRQMLLLVVECFAKFYTSFKFYEAHQQCKHILKKRKETLAVVFLKSSGLCWWWFGSFAISKKKKTFNTQISSSDWKNLKLANRMVGEFICYFNSHSSFIIMHTPYLKSIQNRLNWLFFVPAKPKRIRTRKNRLLAWL